MRSNRGFTLIEVLIASLILFFAILTLNAAFKQYTSYRLKQERYANIYISVLSLKDKLENEDLRGFTERKGTINGLSYDITIRPLKNEKNYVYGQTAGSTGNKGQFDITLYKATLVIDGEIFTFFETQYRKTR